MLKKQERRKYPRYNTEAKIYFHVNYDLKTKVRFRVFKKDDGVHLSRKYAALSRNISAGGICFNSGHKLKKGDSLYLEVYLPRRKKPIIMTGEARWSKAAPSAKGADRFRFDSGVKLLTLYGRPISESIHFDRKHQIIWSDVLESIFGSFRKLLEEMKNAGKNKC